MKRLCQIDETPIPLAVLAITQGDMLPSSRVMADALQRVEALEHEAQQVTAVRQRLVDLPAVRPLEGEHMVSPLLL